jgi:antitoxin component of MazEF toxin-antitoxin module
MRFKTKLVRDGNSWAIRLPKPFRLMAGLKGGDTIYLEIKQDKIIIWPQRKRIIDDKFEQARRDAKQGWDEAFEDIWFETVGDDE